MATLLPMRVFHWRAGIHGLSRPPAKRYAAFVQAEPVTVMRYRQGADTGWFGINHHRGGVSSTSSLGCQTYKPDGWIAARNLLYGALGDTEQEVMEGSHSNCAFPYVVVPLDQADKILKGSATNPPGKSPTPKASVAWSLLLRDFPNQPNMVYGKAINVAGRLYVPVRDFCAQVIPCDPKDAPLEWTSGTAAGEVLKIEGKAVEDVMEIEEHAYVWIVEVAKALKLDILYIDAARNLVITPQ